MPIESIAATATNILKPRPLPPGVDNLIVSSRRGWRIGMRIAAGVLGGGALAGSLLLNPQTRDRNTRWLIAAGAGAAALGGGSFLVRDATAKVLATNIDTLADAVSQADAYDRAVGVLQHQDKHHIVDLAKLYDLDQIGVRRLPEFQVGDGKVSFEALVTQDGDLLTPIAAGAPRGYTNTGAAAPRLDLASLEGKPPKEIDAALTGLRIGTDDQHRALTIGARVGKSDGYAGIEEMFRDTFGQTGQETIALRVGSRLHAFQASGPSRQHVQLRGTQVDQLDSILATSRKALWQGVEPGADFSFVRRMQPFTPDEVIGQRLTVRGVAGVPSQWIDSYPSFDSAEFAVQRQARNDAGWQGEIHTSNYAIVEGSPDQYGRFFVYRRGGRQVGVWEPELGQVRGMTWVDRETRTQEHNWGDEIIREHQRREIMYLRPESGYDRYITDTPWYTYSTERIRRPSTVQ